MKEFDMILVMDWIANSFVNMNYRSKVVNFTFLRAIAFPSTRVFETRLVGLISLFLGPVRGRPLRMDAKLSSCMVLILKSKK